MGKLKHIPQIGNKYGDWEVIDDKIYKRTTNRESYWLVRCKCGREETRAAGHLIKGRTNSCKSCAATVNSFEQNYLNRIKNRAKTNNYDFDLTLEYILNIFDGKCKLSGEEISFGKIWKSKTDQTASLDRIENSKGYIKGNVQWVHKDVNFMKRILQQERFIDLCKKIADNV